MHASVSSFVLTDNVLVLHRVHNVDVRMRAALGMDLHLGANDDAGIARM